MLTDFQKSFNGKFATNSYLNIPPHLKYVASLPCDIWMSENWQQSEICIVFNDKSQDSTAKHLSYDGLLHYKFVNHCASERIFKILVYIYTLCLKKKQDTKLLPITSPHVNRFSKFFHWHNDWQICNEVTHHNLNAWLCYLVIYR